MITGFLQLLDRFWFIAGKHRICIENPVIFLRSKTHIIACIDQQRSTIEFIAPPLLLSTSLLQQPYLYYIDINSVPESESQRPTALLKKESELACLTGTDLFVRRPVPVLTNGHTDFCASDWY